MQQNFVFCASATLNCVHIYQFRKDFYPIHPLDRLGKINLLWQHLVELKMFIFYFLKGLDDEKIFC